MREYDSIEEHPYMIELFASRMLFHAATAKAWSQQGLYEVHKSVRHYDGSLCCGGDMFLVVAKLPSGIISNHYPIKDWMLFDIEEQEKSTFPYDGHKSQDVLERLRSLLLQECRR